MIRLTLSKIVFLLLAVPVQLLHAQWQNICPARESFFDLNLQQENYVTPEELLTKYMADPKVDLIVLGEAHFQPSLGRADDLLEIIAQNPAYNCLFIEATEESWLREKEAVSGFQPDHPLYFIKEFHEKLETLPMAIGLIDERERFDSWLKDHPTPVARDDLKEMAYEEITYRNLVMSRRIAESMKGSCTKGVLLIGASHLASFSHGYPVSGIKELLQFEGFYPKAIQLLDSELFIGVDETLNDSISSPALCFNQCASNPDLPAQEVAFEHIYPENISLTDLALLDASKVDVHYGAPTVGRWTDFDATILFPPKFIRSCRDSRRGGF